MIDAEDYQLPLGARSLTKYCHNMQTLGRNEEKQAAGNAGRIVIGVDEAGRGPLCGMVFSILSPYQWQLTNHHDLLGPVVAAACIVPADIIIEGVVDSKKLTDEQVRERVYADLTNHPKIMWCATVISNEKIDEINILQATMLAMRESTCGLIKKHKISASALKSHIALIDGNRVPTDMPVEAKFVIKVSSFSCSCTCRSHIDSIFDTRI
jgi:ribonuclease HII